MLDDLVLSVGGASADDAGVAVALQGERVLADVDPPYVLDGAGAEAVDAFDLVLADYGVGEGCAVFEDEDGVLSPPSAWPVHDTPRP